MINKPDTYDTQTVLSIPKELFNGNMRDFTKEEAEIYKIFLKNVYKKTDANIFDIV